MHSLNDWYVQTGNPDVGRACFTRFLLPFKWSKMPFSGPVEGSVFTPSTSKDVIHGAHNPGQSDDPWDHARTRYFSRETNTLLHDRAEWFTLRDNNQHEHGVWKSLELGSTLKDSDATYTIHVRPPTLVLFEFESSGKDVLGNGFLIHEVFFGEGEDAPSYADLLAFNEIFRYWRCPYEKHRTDCSALLNPLYQGWMNPNDKTKVNDVPDDELYASHWLPLFSCPVVTGDVNKAMFHIVPPDQEHNGKAFPDWVIHHDDRAFSCCFAAVEDPKNVPSSKNSKLPQRGPDLSDTLKSAYQGENQSWLAFLNVDKPYSENLSKISDFEKEWLKKRSYLRWAHFGTLQGFSEHSTAMLCPASWQKNTKLDAEGADPTVNPWIRGQGDPELAVHFAYHYFDSTLLLLFLRCSIFRFSAELHSLSARAKSLKAHRDEAWQKHWREEFRSLRWQFMYLENLYQFPILSNQQQHLEMFEQQRQVLDLRDLYEEVSREVKSSDDLFDSLLNEHRNELADWLNRIGFIGLALGLALGVLDAAGASGKALKLIPGTLFLFLFFALLLLGSGFLLDHYQNPARQWLWTQFRKLWVRFASPAWHWLSAKVSTRLKGQRP